MPANDKWSQYEVTAPAAGPDKWAQYEAKSAPPVTTAPSEASPASASPEGFWASVAAPFIGTAKGLKSAVYEGPQNPTEAKIVGARPGVSLLDDASPIIGRAVLAAKRILVDPQVEQGKQAASEFRQANAETPWYSLKPSPDAVEHRELATGHALAAALPFLGPWAANVGEKEGEQIGTGNYKGAAGTGVGNLALALTPKAIGKTGEAISATPEFLARSVTDTGTGPVKRLVKETQAANEKIDAVNADRIEAQRRAQAKADYDHRADLLKLKQSYEQSVRDAGEKARTGTAADRAQVQSKNLTARQKYEQSVRDAQTAYETKKAAAEQANTQAQREHNQKIGQAAQQNRAVTVAQREQTARAAKLQVGGSQLIYGLRQLDQALNTRAAVMFDGVRDLVTKSKQPPLPGTNLGTAARAALTKVSGSSEIPKPFRDILAKYPEAEPATISYQGAEIPQGHPLYDVLAKNGGLNAPPVTFGDLQGYYSETGAELSKGTLPGDVYQATKELHNVIGNMMQKMANDAGAGKQFWDSRIFYRDYMNTFHEPTGPSGSGSPVAQALLAKDPQVAADKFSGDAGDRGIAILRRYSGSLANLAQDVQRTAQTKISVPAGKSVTEIHQPKTSSIPAGPGLPLPPVVENIPAPRAANLSLPPVLPEPKTVPLELKSRQKISTPDLVAARRAAAEDRAARVNTRGTWVSTWPIFQAMRALWGGHIPSIPTMALESAGTFATTRAATALMNYPPMIRFLTEARPEDLALIPPELRGDLPGLISQAQRQGIKVAPALVAAAAGAGQPSSQDSFTPAQAIQAMQPQPVSAQTGGPQ